MGPQAPLRSKSQRSVEDEQALLGVATTRSEERLLASLGQLQVAPIRFEAAADVPKGGVLCALPALLALGLLRHSQKSFALPAGYYPLETIFLSIAFLALARNHTMTNPAAVISTAAAINRIKKSSFMTHSFPETWSGPAHRR